MREKQQSGYTAPDDAGRIVNLSGQAYIYFIARVKPGLRIDGVG